MSSIPQGANLINGNWVRSQDSFTSQPVSGAPQSFSVATEEQVHQACVAAEAAFAGADQRLPMFSVAAAKVSASEAASQAAAIGHSVHGAIGFTQEYALHMLTRRLWSWRSEFGSSTFWSKALGEHVCAAGSADFWPMLTNPELQDLSTTQ